MVPRRPVLLAATAAVAAALPAGSVADFGPGCHDGPFFARQEPASLRFLARGLT